MMPKIWYFHERSSFLLISVNNVTLYRLRLHQTNFGCIQLILVASNLLWKQLKLNFHLWIWSSFSVISAKNVALYRHRLHQTNFGCNQLFVKTIKVDFSFMNLLYLKFLFNFKASNQLWLYQTLSGCIKPHTKSAQN